MPKKQPSPSELAEKAAHTDNRAGPNCWAKNAEGALKEYLEILIGMFREDKGFNQNLAVEQAQRYYGVKVRRSAFMTHIKGQCSCEREKA